MYSFIGITNQQRKVAGRVISDSAKENARGHAHHCRIHDSRAIAQLNAKDHRLVADARHCTAASRDGDGVDRCAIEAQTRPYRCQRTRRQIDAEIMVRRSLADSITAREIGANSKHKWPLSRKERADPGRGARARIKVACTFFWL